MTTTPTSGTHSRARRAGIAAFVGTTIEWYDFYVYATAAALVFGPLFFPSGDRLAETAAAFATFAVAFLVRPWVASSSATSATSSAGAPRS